MLKYTIKRLLYTIPVILCVAFIIFTLLYFTPGDPAVVILGSSASQEELDSYRAYLGIDRPYIVQLGDYFYKLFIARDLGVSWISKLPIMDEISMRLPRTFIISLYSILCGALFGIPLGVYAATHQNSFGDKFILLLSTVMHTIPGYVIALILIIIFAYNLRILPAYGIDQGLKSYILPCLSILLSSFAGMARSMRTSMLEIVRSDFVTSARAQGFSRHSVYYRHALPNALIPIITQVGQQFAHALSGTMILESIFSIPGMGNYIQTAISNRDIPIVCGSTIFLAIWFCLVMLAVDLLYAAVDPRIRDQYTEQNGSGFFKKLFGRREA